MLHLAHFGHRIGKLDNCRMRVASRQDHMHHFRLLLQRFDHLRRIKHTVADRIIDLVQYHQVPFARLDRASTLGPRFFHHADVFRIRLLRANFHEPTSHLLHDEFVTESFGRVQFPVVPRTFDELQHQHTHPVPHGAQSRAHGGSRLALARPSIHDDQTTTNIGHMRTSDCTCGLNVSQTLNIPLQDSGLVRDGVSPVQKES